MSEIKPLVSLYTLIKDLDQLVRRRLEERVRAAGLDLTRPQYRVLIMLDRSPGITQARLAELLDVERMTVTGLLDRMETRGWVERRRDPNDRRANRLYLKPAAKPLLDRLANLGAEMMEVVLDGVSMASIERTLKELGTVKDNLRTAIARNTNQQQAVAG